MELERGVVLFGDVRHRDGDGQRGVVAESCEAGVDALGDETVVVKFAEDPVGAAFAGRFDAVAVVD